MYLGPIGVVQSSKPNIREYCSLTPLTDPVCTLVVFVHRLGSQVSISVAA